MTPRIVKLVAEIDEFKGYWKGMQTLSSETLSTLRVLATIESIGSSTRIEGARLNDSEVSALLQGLDVQSFRSRDEQEVAGYAKAMHLIYDSNQEIDLTENNIKYLHKVLLQFSTKDEWHLGEYKKHPNHVAAFDSAGNQIGLIFETTSPVQTPLMMESLVDMTQNRLSDDNFHPLLAISDFVLRFLAIHPFQDGNGRLSRILTNLILIREGYDFVQYSSHERIVEANKDRYYLALRESQNNLESDPDIELKWAEFFLEMLSKQKNHLMGKIDRESRARRLPALSEKIVQLAQEHGRINIAFISKALEANRNTVKKHVRQLIENRRLVRHGKGRGTYYSPY
ncbi:Filamentation induced by cAMP protein Fic [Olavius algarvensis Delta 1 endosymbiont]|nr:Filamentation induced by cAMP protein Fic [Olavius algarvensis Delta 1 endosymbiont]